tara:strand:- start:2028 stop:2825 length:798 start_codon:yes stop_codon:yes gene_type:complete
MQSSDLDLILSKLKNSEENITEFDESWSQGRSAFGGVAAAFAVTAMQKLLESNQPMRSLMVSFIAPVPPGEVYVDANIQRRGKNVTQTQANVICENVLCLQAMAAFGNSREALHVPPSENLNATPKELGIKFEDHAKRVPGFLKFFEGAWVDGGFPFAGKLNRELKMWVRHRTNLSDYPAEKLVTICDIPPPVILSHFQQPPVPSSSLTWSLEFVIPPEEIATEWFYLDFVVEAAENGYTQQSGRVYDENGRLCALSRQCMVYFG